jgi:hypothetical protein
VVATWQTKDLAKVANDALEVVHREVPRSNRHVSFEAVGDLGAERSKVGLEHDAWWFWLCLMALHNRSSPLRKHRFTILSSPVIGDIGKDRVGESKNVLQTARVKFQTKPPHSKQSLSAYFVSKHSLLASTMFVQTVNISTMFVQTVNISTMFVHAVSTSDVGSKSHCRHDAQTIIVNPMFDQAVFVGTMFVRTRLSSIVFSGSFLCLKVAKNKRTSSAQSEADSTF